MNRPGTIAASHAASEPLAPPAWRDWVTLVKPEITFLVTITAAAGFVLGSPNSTDWGAFAALLVGVALSSAGGATLNHVFERPFDALMRRTATRPLPSGRIAPTHAAWFGIGLIAAGLGILCPLTNPLTGVLAAVTVVLYLLVYTPLKRRTVMNTLVGTVPGALPALGGWTAATGSISGAGWILFAVVLFWQVPHFLALAWMYRGDYARASFRMLPVESPDGGSTAAHVVVATVLMLVASVLPVTVGLTGPTYGVGATIAGAWFLLPVASFVREMGNRTARALLKATIWYIPALVILIVADRLVRA